MIVDEIMLFFLADIAFVGAFAKNMAITAAGGAILAPMAELSAAIAETARLSMLKPHNPGSVRTTKRWQKS